MTTDKKEVKEVKGQFHYEQDSKRFHRFQVRTGDSGVVGTIYVPKGEVPKRIVLEYSK